VELILATRGGSGDQREAYQRGRHRLTDDQLPSGAGTPRLGVVPLVTKDNPAADPQVQSHCGALGLGIEVPGTVRIVAVQTRSLAVAPEAAVIVAYHALQTTRPATECQMKRSKIAVERVVKWMI